VGVRGRRGGLALCACVGALALLALVPSAASAITFGANLSARTPDNPTACNDPGWFFFTTFNTCSFVSTNLATGESGFPPVGRGVITKVRVKVGPVTGPMQIVVEEALRTNNPASPGNPGYVCCKAINASPVFTPTAGTTFEQRVNLPIRQDLAPDPVSGAYVDQHLALSVLAPNVPIPADIDPNGSFSGWFPAWTVGEQRTGPYGGSGAVVLFNADWQSCAGKATAQSAKKRKRKRSPCGGKKRKKKRKR
jgi:hypothetical protein